MTATLTDRILDAFPNGNYALTALLRLTDIVETDAVPTAAVECKLQPRLLINPAFVATHAHTQQKLLMLVMHELHHVLLGHTTLFPRVTKAQNFVFDAVINGVISRMFPRVEFLAFLRDYYGASMFPHCLLAPPPGWPDNPRMPEGLRCLPTELSAQAWNVHQALYSAAGASYAEVYELLPKLLLQCGAQSIDALIDRVPLLGDHSGDGLSSGLEHGSPLMFDIVRSIVEQWPQPPDPIRGRSLAKVLRQVAVVPQPVPSNRQQLRRLILKVAEASRVGCVRKLCSDPIEAPTPIPSLARRSLVLRALGYEPLLHPGAVPTRRRAATGGRVHVYLDVSGSMKTALRSLYGAILDCRDQVERTVHLFSDAIADVPLAELRTGKCKTTGGTNIACVAEHMAKHRITRALIVTDGWVGEPKGEHRNTLAKAHVAVAFLGAGINENDLRAVARHTCILNRITERESS